MAIDEEEVKRIPFEVHFLKNNDFRSAFASGVYGGSTPNGLINMNFFVDRSPLPKKITYFIDPDKPALLDALSEKDSKNGLVREVQFGVLLDLSTAKATVEWLQGHIESIEKSRNNAEQE